MVGDKVGVGFGVAVGDLGVGSGGSGTLVTSGIGVNVGVTTGVAVGMRVGSRLPAVGETVTGARGERGTD